MEIGTERVFHKNPVAAQCPVPKAFLVWISTKGGGKGDGIVPGIPK
jgi:hypothetical protein